MKRLMIRRHGGDDTTMHTQADMLESLGDIMKWLKFTVAAFGGISLLVGGVGIFTIMTVAVNERTSEIGGGASRILRRNLTHFKGRGYGYQKL